jgi:hypothetical protein
MNDQSCKKVNDDKYFDIEGVLFFQKLLFPNFLYYLPVSFFSFYLETHWVGLKRRTVVQ